MTGKVRTGVTALLTAGTIWGLSGALVPGSPNAGDSIKPEHQYAGWQSVRQQRALDEAATRSAAEAAERAAATEQIERSIASGLVRP